MEEQENDPRSREERESEAAGQEAAAIGGRAGDEDLDPAERPVVEGGGGVAEGFELAEEDLVEHASHGDAGGNPLEDAFPAEDAAAPDEGSFGEADHEHSSEN
jgi:hypothetical protein